MCKQAKAEEKTYTMSDGRGLMLEVRPNGSKLWIVRYWIAKKEHRKSMGTYPEVTLKEARDKNIDFRRALESGKPIGADNETFATVTAEWLAKRMNTKSEGHLRAIRHRLNNFIYPGIGHMKLSDITSGVILQLCRRIEEKGTVDTASRVRQYIGQIFNYAIATDRADTNPTLALRGALREHKEKHYATITNPVKIGILMRQIDAYPYGVVRCALKFSALTFARPGEVRAAEWSEIDWDNKEWRIPEARMKMKRLHIVPLARQTLDVLTELKGMTGHQKWLFPSARRGGRYMSETAVRSALRSMGYGNEDIVPHGFRAMASTTFYENGFSKDHIEKQLSHEEKNKIIKSYNHAEYLPQRREMMQWWADWLDGVRNSVS
jgi:integrase